MGRMAYCNLCGGYHDTDMTYCGGGSWGGVTAGVGSAPSYEPTGWVCPRCEKVHAPFVTACDCDPPISRFQTANTRAAHPHEEEDADG